MSVVRVTDGHKLLVVLLEHVLVQKVFALVEVQQMVVREREGEGVIDIVGKGIGVEGEGRQGLRGVLRRSGLSGGHRTGIIIAPKHWATRTIKLQKGASSDKLKYF